MQFDQEIIYLYGNTLTVPLLCCCLCCVNVHMTDSQAHTFAIKCHVNLVETIRNSMGNVATASVQYVHTLHTTSQSNRAELVLTVRCLC